MNKKLIRLLTLTALLIGASAHAMETPEQLGLQLCLAAARGNLVHVGKLLQQGAPIDATYAFDRTPLAYAARHGHSNVCRLLLDHGASVNAKDWYGGTPLSLAAFEGHTDTCRLLLDNKASVDAKNIVGSTPLRHAAYWGHTNICHLLIDTIVTQIKESKAMAIALLGLRNRGKISYLNPIDKNVIRLIARKVVYDSAPSREKQRQNLFAQLDSNRCDAPWITKLKEELRAYAHGKL